jgi:hypothetical protein
MRGFFLKKDDHMPHMSGLDVYKPHMGGFSMSGRYDGLWNETTHMGPKQAQTAHMWHMIIFLQKHFI